MLLRAEAKSRQSQKCDLRISFSWPWPWSVHLCVSVLPARECQPSFSAVVRMLAFSGGSAKNFDIFLLYTSLHETKIPLFAAQKSKRRVYLLSSASFASGINLSAILSILHFLTPVLILIVCAITKKNPIRQKIDVKFPVELIPTPTCHNVHIHICIYRSLPRNPHFSAYFRFPGVPLFCTPILS